MKFMRNYPRDLILRMQRSILVTGLCVCFADTVDKRRNYHEVHPDGGTARGTDR